MLLGAELGAMRFVRRLGMLLRVRLRMRLGMMGMGMGMGRVDGLLERWLRLGLGLWLWLGLWLRLGLLLRVRFGMRLGMRRVDGLLERWEKNGTRASGRSSSLQHGQSKEVLQVIREQPQDHVETCYHRPQQRGLQEQSWKQGERRQRGVGTS
jgi:hypothetical protein